MTDTSSTAAEDGTATETTASTDGAGQDAPLSVDEAVDATRDEILAEAREGMDGTTLIGEDPDPPAADAAGNEGGDDTGSGDPEPPAGGDATPPADDEVEALLSQAPEPLRQAWAARAAQLEAEEHRRKTAEGRYTSAQRRLDSLIAGDGADGRRRPATRANATDTRPAAQQGDDTLESELAQWREDYPEIAGPVSKLLDRLNGSLEEVRAENERLRAGFLTQSDEREAQHYEDQERQVLDAHPDYDAIRSSAEFRQWLDGQSDTMMALVTPNAETIQNAADVSFIIGRYKAETGYGGNGDGSDTARRGRNRNQATAARRELQRRSATGLPRPSPGAGLPERGAPPKSLDDVRAQIIEEAHQREQADARR